MPAALASLKTTHLSALGLDLVDATQAQAIAALLAPGRRRAYFMNAHCCNIRRRDTAYAQAVATADMLLPDGIGVELAGRMTGKRLTANLNGTDLVPALLAQAASMGKSVYLFGGTPGTAQAAANRLANTIPGLRIAGTRDGFAGAADTDAVIHDINDSGADIVLVALGVPMQELWLHANAHRIDAPLTLAVGALFDFLAGTVSRAPKAVRRARMEWVWRLAQEPRRMAKRYLAGNTSFLAHAGIKALGQLPVADVQRRFLDVTVAGSALVLLSPLLALTALAIKADSRGPVLFSQTRVGKNGKEFRIFKFRSMTTDAETRRDALLASSDREGVCFKSRHDPRVTSVGRFIRRFSIDELPQILNVLRGEMAIVGPRPALPCEVAAYPARALGRLAVKPGITGVWQVSGRATIGFDQMVEMDLSYADSRTLMLDFILILKTFGAVTSGRGAY
ncbi:WecB/TagA/CpsF family glycosyltransferase [Sulfitobacter pseudonitzschiae]|uniref:WecB/TagA/CpsF family glycosyltransferase n=1 Tax=Pseudosulfitobacter pseudonitzschiae TaxID=1402135 RepID=A0A9Q2NSP5_9RHOB|nr:WecB/TagA/CpsF family glycosyltransferase [Pseudosulfitobacter pseudonitzschiae]MBM2296672.1 WecB/TagA/CpsF family glycosyltransferase [Pseudosulfitobacter pseudonitzschiae]MBM2301585.1 WecB/TagA/CpsF family glycosyltransferase [Pseudosulfitobacter pseudonitzschiae]MBM2311368.1 WecB/TagA/CpsF family glycosyltransferase [Pseudosulfitobacter pseudonitzschiae]MBM2316282.1 WecB/TagA/CpsF family glycosyltransferase [Pseudosulfitobacter pseudonitzschiae]